MRITGGRARGIPLICPKGDATRPATDRMREAVFSSLGPRVEGARVADLFAGTGAYGLEAMSRGAASCLWIESHAAALACLRQNLAAAQRSADIEASDDWQILAADVYTLSRWTQLVDLFFIDPPYALVRDNTERIFTQVVNPNAAEDARACFEMPANFEPDIEGWALLKRWGKGGGDAPTVALFQKG